MSQLHSAIIKDFTVQPILLSDRQRKIIEEFFPDPAEHADIYMDLHQHPELPCQEQRTASIVAERLETVGFEVQRGIGGYGVIGILRNGKGQTVLLRSELDPLPIKEETGVPYASKVEQVGADGITKRVMHACAHDMHMTCLLGAAALLYDARKAWSGTLIVLFQPNEERLLGAEAIIDDGLLQKIPCRVRVYGRGAHGATPQLAIDPIMLAASIIIRLQTIVSREIDPKEAAVIGCGTFYAGTDASIIPDYADFQLDVRTFSENIQRLAKAAVERIIRKECEVAGSPTAPRIVTVVNSPAIDNDEVATGKFTRVLECYYGSRASEAVQEMPPDIVADDFVLLALPPGGKPIPYCNIGVTNPETWERADKEGKFRDLPPTRSVMYAPAIEPTLRAGIEALALSALTFLQLL